MSVDVTKDFTVKVEKVTGKPKAKIVDAFAWLPGKPGVPIKSAKPGSKINITVTVCNVGDAEGKLFALVMDKDTTVIVCPEQTSPNPVKPGCRDQVSFVWKNLTMPSHDWHLEARAGHIEEEYTLPYRTPPYGLRP